MEFIVLFLMWTVFYKITQKLIENRMKRYATLLILYYFLVGSVFFYTDYLHIFKSSKGSTRLLTIANDLFAELDLPLLSVNAITNFVSSSLLILITIFITVVLILKSKQILRRIFDNQLNRFVIRTEETIFLFSKQILFCVLLYPLVVFFTVNIGLYYYVYYPGKYELIVFNLFIFLLFINLFFLFSVMKIIVYSVQENIIFNLYLFSEKRIHDIFESYIQKGEVLLTYKEIDPDVKLCIEMGIFFSTYLIDFHKQSELPYQIYISKQSIKQYKKAKNRFSFVMEKQN